MCTYLFLYLLIDLWYNVFLTSGQEHRHDAFLFQYQLLASAVPRHPPAATPITDARTNYLFMCLSNALELFALRNGGPAPYDRVSASCRDMRP